MTKSFPNLNKVTRWPEILEKCLENPIKKEALQISVKVNFKFKP